MSNDPITRSGTVVDGANPWLGLASFTEETRAYFHGREDEIAELARRVQRRPLTVLFGQSGLGKTSILQAGIVPLLRAEGHCPVYVRLDYAPESPSPADQIKRALYRTTLAAGAWTQIGAAVEGESLWEFLHHRDDVLKDAAGRTLTPLLIFDQFEEIFTLAQTDETGRKRAREFLADLADLVENRPPATLEARIERDEADATRFDFARADYRILISLREDYLANLEGLKATMPSVTQNRMRLARMTGAQAFAAVRDPAPQLVSEPVAEAIVRFVSGVADLARAEVEPSLLSLICRELNATRQARGHAAISDDLLAGSRETILTEFYERALADQPPAVRHFVEDVLLTDSGFRESVAEERVRKSFVAAGAPSALATLVDRRLLRIEERLDTRRVELTHDVLCGVVKASRNTRRAREAKEAAERQLAETEAKERATRAALVRARTVAVFAIVLMVLAVAGGIYGWLSQRRATVAERRARETQQLADTARQEAEGLLGYLLTELKEKLEDSGQVAVGEQLSRRVVEYYRHLPPELVTTATDRKRATALSLLGRVLNAENHIDEAVDVQTESLEIFRRLIAGGDRSVETAELYADALAVRGTIYGNQLLPQALQASREAVAVLRPFVKQANPSTDLQTKFAGLVMSYAWAELNRDPAEAERAFQESARYALAAGGDDPKNERASFLYAIVLKGLAYCADRRGDSATAFTMVEHAIALETALLERSPWRTPVLQERAGAYAAMAGSLYHLGRMREALTVCEKSAADFAGYLQFNPTDSQVRTWAIGNENTAGLILLKLGRPRESGARFKAALDAASQRPVSSAFAMMLSINAFNLSWTLAEVHDHAGAEAAIAETKRLSKKAVDSQPAESVFSRAAEETVKVAALGVAEREGDISGSLYDEAEKTVVRLRKLDLEGSGAGGMGYFSLQSAYFVMANTAVDMGRYVEAEAAARELKASLEATREKTSMADVPDAIAGATGLLGESIARQGRQEEARALLGPFVAATRSRMTANPEDVMVRALLVELLLSEAAAQQPAEQAQRHAILDDAERLFASLTDEVKGSTSGRRTAKRLAAARAEN